MSVKGLVKVDNVRRRGGTQEVSRKDFLMKYKKSIQKMFPDTLCVKKTSNCKIRERRIGKKHWRKKI